MFGLVIQDAIIEVAKSTAEMIDKAGAGARPDRVEVEFGLKFSASGTVIMAGVAGEASLQVTLGYDVTARRQQLGLSAVARVYSEERRAGYGRDVADVAQQFPVAEDETTIPWAAPLWRTGAWSGA